MVNLKRLAVGVVFCLAPYWSGGALADSRTYNLPELEEMALKTLPALKIAGAEIRKSEAELRIARQYPNPEVEGLVSSQRAMEGGTYGTGLTVGLSQTLEWPGRRGKKQEAARFGINSAQQKLTQEQIPGPLPGTLLRLDKRTDWIHIATRQANLSRMRKNVKQRREVFLPWLWTQNGHQGP